MKRLIVTISLAIAAMSVGLVPLSAQAATCGGVTTSIDYSCGSGNPIIAFATAIIKYVGGLIGLVVVLMIIIGGVQYAISSGDAKAVAAAKSRIINSVIALILYILMFGILQYLIPGGVIK